MITIEVLKNDPSESREYAGITIEGHASFNHGPKGQNILCAAVSALSQGLLLYLQTMGSLKEFSVNGGNLSILVSSKADPIHINEPFRLIILTLERLSEQYPEEIVITETNVF